MNSRLDEMQAAVLRARLPYLSRWTARRRELARGLQAAPPGCAGRRPRGARPRPCLPSVPVLVEDGADARAALQRQLRAAGIDTLVHYPIPIHRQPAFADLRPADCPRADDACARVLSLPLHPALDGAAVAAVADALRGQRPN